MNVKNKLFKSNISKAEFFSKYWNQKPYLFKAAISNPNELGDFEDFFDLASDPEFETRVVYEKGGDYPWQAKSGPFTKKDFKKKALWTLICHSLELFNEELYTIKSELDFIPTWQFDDVMATISKKGASVGAHIDDYSVFIFQGRGKRKWLLQSDASPDYISDLDIRLLREFKPDVEYVLEPGDMIYLPPNLAHHGVSLEDSISYSIGFKSIRYEQLLSTLLTCDDLNLEKFSFHEPKNILQDDPFLVSPDSHNNIKKDLIKMISDEENFSTALLRHLSKPKSEILNNGKLIKKLDSLKNKKIRRDIWTKFVSIKIDSKNFKISINGKIYIINSKDYILFKNIFQNSPHHFFKLEESHFKSSSFSKIFIELYNEGTFYC